MIKNKYFWPTIVFLSFAISIFIEFRLDSFDIGSWLLRTVGIIVFPGIASLIIAGATKLIEKELDKSTFNQVFSICWVLGLFLLLFPS
jgi:hypothetical protein